jgi:hypothetical protein
MVKERARAYFNGRLPFTPTGLGVVLLVLYIVSRLNFQKSGVTGGCPREEFTRRRVDESRNFSAPFGDYVVCTESRVTDGNVVLPTDNRTGSVKVYNIATQKIITRDQFKICPMPDSVIACLNSQALAEGRKLTSPHMHVFDKPLISRKLSASNSPTYFTPLLMQDKVDMHSLNETDVQPAVVKPGTPVPEFIPHDRLGGDTNNLGAGPAVQNDFHTLLEDA